MPTSVPGSRRLPSRSERANLDPFEALAGDIAPRDQRDLMERPFFSLAKTKRLTPIQYRAGNTEVQVYAVPEHGMATIWDADVLIWAASHLVEAADRGLPTSRFFRFTPYKLLSSIGRATGNREYHLLRGALTRLQSTVIRTTIRHGEQWHRQQFSWINEWEELVTSDGRRVGMEFVLPDWFYRGVIDRRLVLTIDPGYFALTGGIERWLYRVARKHAGRQAAGWRFDLRHLYAKSASLARFSDFTLDLRRIVARQPLPGYALAFEREIDRDGRQQTLLAIRPVDKPVGTLGMSCHAIATSGAPGTETSGAPITGLRARAVNTDGWFPKQDQQLQLVLEPLNLSNLESNLLGSGPARETSSMRLPTDLAGKGSGR